MFDSSPEISTTRAARDAALYLAHVEAGESLSQIGRREGVAPSTVLRAVRRIEDRRDDPLFEQFLTELGRAAPTDNTAQDKENLVRLNKDSAARKREFDRECRRLLRKLEEPKSFLLAAQGAEKAGVFSPLQRIRQACRHGAQADRAGDAVPAT